MPLSSFTPSSTPGTIHHYAPRLVAFEDSSVLTRGIPNTLIWIGGLSDGLFTVKYTSTLAQALPPDWSLVRPLLSSSYNGWGTSSLKRDVKELGKLVDYLRGMRKGAVIVLMGHSTGCQDCIEYATGEGASERPPIDGIILQAPVSDREAMIHMMPDQYRPTTELAQRWLDDGKGEDVLPNSATKAFFDSTPVTARRWLSLASPNRDGDDDFFSSDLSTESLRKTFGALKRSTPLLVLFGGQDQYVPDSIDKAGLVARWTATVKAAEGAVDEVNGGVVRGASHNLDGDAQEVVEDLIQRVKRYLRRLDDEDFRGAREPGRVGML
ncbi:siderophore biosynthesis lipase/esterase-like protein [Cryomyces antarcticus]|nr:hypothetical protein LTR60_002276 [Cryomyces antarcticus]